MTQIVNQSVSIHTFDRVYIKSCLIMNLCYKYADWSYDSLLRIGRFAHIDHPPVYIYIKRINEHKKHTYI